jgi:3-deoxy-manno-octulosonate cytidylyltransferase (CMP-KDO synthetase)
LKIIGIIPARYASTRFPGKPLVVINGKSMIQRVYEQASNCTELDELVVATDDERILKHVNVFGGKAVMTSPNHNTGTERCNEVIQRLPESVHYDIAINIQGDEPFLEPAQVSQVIGCFRLPGVNIATLVKKIVKTEELMNPDVVKVTFDKNGKALYFSRHPVPYFRGRERPEWIAMQNYYKHIGIYGYTTPVLGEIALLERSSLEKAESLEQLRWMENGYSMHISETEIESIAIDSPADLLKITNRT